MGKIFLEHSNGEELFDCAACNTNLTHKGHLESIQFVGITGRAFLFAKVVNIKLGDITDSFMLTGLHKIRDVTCKKCDARLGWMYELATEESQRYKEGKVVLERSLLVESVGFPPS